MTPTQIKILLLEKGIRQSDLARALHVTPCMISGLIARRWKSKRLQEAIAHRLGVKADALWKTEHSKAA